MIGKKHKPPSRERYEQNNPNWTVRLTLNLYNALQEFLKKTGYSRRSFIRMALGKMKMNFERIKDETYTKGIDDGERNGYSMGESDGYNKGKQVGYKEGHLEGLEEGEEIGGEKAATEWYEKGKKVGRIWYFCAICGERLFIEPGSDDHMALIELLRYHGWGHHPECP